ncbi:MAG: two-component system sensor histidine kinase NtrB [Candidatus Acidiferrales bacterium]
MPESLKARASQPAAKDTKAAVPASASSWPAPPVRILPGLTQQGPPRWIDLLLILFLIGLALLPPIGEIHKQLILLAIAIVQLAEGKLLNAYPQRGRYYAVALKLVLATLLIDHTGEWLTIESSYYPIYYLPVMTAAMYFDTAATLLWTLLASAAYCSYLFPALQEYSLDADAATQLTIRILFFFLVAIVVNRFSIELRLQASRYQTLADRLTATNLRLEQAQAEARRSERLAALGQMSAGLAHEIRNPLGVIKGSAEMLMQKLQNASPLANELAGYISFEVNRLSALVARFLDFARPLRAERRPEDIAKLLDRVLASVASHWQGGSVAVEKNYERNLPMIPLDENLCERAFLNLVQNAYEAMGDAGGALRVSIVRASSRGRAGVEVRLEDTGPGVPAELSEQIFNPFVTTKKAGVGLGLSIVSQIVDGHHGTIRLESLEGGARFVLFFPAESAPAPKELVSASR